MTTPPVRRIVTGHNEAGRSCIVEDGPPPVVAESPAIPGLRLMNVWATGKTPDDVHAPDRIKEHGTLHPPAGGTVIRVMDIPPEPDTRAGLDEMYAKVAASGMFPDMGEIPSDRTRHPGMHTTHSVDYAIILSGEMYAILEEEETLMKAGDILVQRGTNHAWSNRSGDICRVCFVLVDGVQP